MPIRTAMILAAGRGERMRPLTDEIPKPLLEAGGRPLIDYPLQALARAGVRHAVVNLAWLGGMLRAHLGDGSAFGLRLSYSQEPPGALETGGGIHRALPLLGDGAFWLVNADAYSEYDFARRGLDAGCLAHLVLVPNPPQHRDGDFCLHDGRVTMMDGERLTYAGIAVLHPRLFDGRSPGRYPLAPLLVEAIERGLVSGECYRGFWTDVGTPARLAALDRRLRGRLSRSD